MLFIIKLIAAGFFVSINVFTFLLIKFQKNDRDLLLLKGVASGSTQAVPSETQQKKPHKAEVQIARNVLLSEEDDRRPESDKDNSKHYAHVYAGDSQQSASPHHSDKHGGSVHSPDADKEGDTQNSDIGSTRGGGSNGKPTTENGINNSSGDGKDNHQADGKPHANHSHEQANRDKSTQHAGDGQNTGKPQSGDSDTQQSEDIQEDDTGELNPRRGDDDSLSKDEQSYQKNKLVTKYGKKPVSDIKLLLCAVLGGALGIYVALFVYKYRLRDILMMVVVPTIMVLNIYIIINVFTIWLIEPVVALVAPDILQQLTHLHLSA